MTQERQDYMRRQEADHDLLRMRDPNYRPTVRERCVIAKKQDCARGEHLYVTGRRSCPLCGSEL